MIARSIVKANVKNQTMKTLNGTQNVNKPFHAKGPLLKSCARTPISAVVSMKAEK